MRLSLLLETPEFKKAEIVVIGSYKTARHEFAVLAKKGDPAFPIPRLFHLVEVSSKNPDPELSDAEIQSIRRRFLGTVFRLP